jgi:hypothetical protein
MVTDSRRNILMNILGGSLAGYGVIAFVCFLWLVKHWTITAPTTSIPALGIIFPHNEHGSITYFSAFQSTSCALLFDTSIPIAMVGAFITPRANVKITSDRLWWRMSSDPDDPRKVGILGGVFGGLMAPIMTFLVGPSVVTWLNGIGVVLRF